MSETKPSRIYIGGMRIAQMREKCQDAFGDNFLSVNVKMPDRIFVVRVSDDASTNAMKKFTEKYRLCVIEVFPRISFIVYRGQKQLAPANKK